MASLSLDVAPAVLWGIPAYYLITLLSHAYGTTFAISKIDKKLLNNSNPRAHAKLFKDKLNERDYARFERASAAHSNGHENFPFYIAAVLGGTLAGLDQSTMSTIAISGVVLRLAYTLVYITNEKRTYSYGRSLLWTGGVLLNTYTLVRAGFAVSS